MHNMKARTAGLHASAGNDSLRKPAHGAAERTVGRICFLVSNPYLFPELDERLYHL